MSTITKDLGVVTAYGYAVSKGYEGTEEEFAELMASYATVAEQAAQSAETAEEAAEAAAQAVLDANAAKTAAQAAQSAAESASTTATSAATSASNSASSATSSASTASTAATTATEKATEAAASATAAAGSATAAQSAQTAAETAQEAAEDAQAAAEAAVSSLADFAPTVENTASGDIASFTDGADDYPVKDLVAHIEPVQSGSGDPSPENVRPITGWTGANVTRTGKNLLDASACIVGRYITSRGEIKATSGWSASDYIPVKSGETYTLSNYNPDGTAANHAFYCVDKSFLSRIPAAGNNTFTVPSGAYYVRVSIKTENLTGAQLELGTTATAYEPYQGDTYAVTFPAEAGTVYGGTLDVTTGVLTVDRGFVDMGTLNWQGWEESGSAIFNAPVVGKVELRTSALICSQYKPDYTVHTWADLENGEITGGGNNNVYIRDIRYSTVADFKTAMAGVQLVYELATPITYQCTPTEVKTLLGANNIFADTGAVDVEYCADTKKYIDNAIAAAVASLS